MERTSQEMKSHLDNYAQSQRTHSFSNDAGNKELAGYSSTSWRQRNPSITYQWFT